ncbi:MAG: hypothetical protein JJE22_18785 [Bacteroidia bacterium]|nr:hypothetical protein [Bacteroidia bacterium]
MKKMILTLAIIISTISAFAGDENVNSKVLNAFTTDFQTAKEIEWTTASDYYMATFVYNDKHLFAYYDREGGLIGLTRYLGPSDLPMNLQMNLKKNYSGYWISDLFEVAKNNVTSYYVTLENSESKIVLKSFDSNNWDVFKKIKKG